MHNKTRKLVGGALLLTLSGISVKLLGLIYKIPLSYILSEEGMGYFNSAYTVYTFFFIVCTAGIPKAISIFVSEAEGDGDLRRMDKIYRTSFLFFGILGIIITVLFFIFAAPIARIVGSRSAAMTMIMISPSVMFTCGAGVIRGYFNGIMNFVPIAVSEAISGISRLVLGLAFALLGAYLKYDLALVSALSILGTTLGSFLGFVYLIIYKKKQEKRENIRQKSTSSLIDMSLLKSVSRLAIPITVTAALGSIVGIIDLSIIMRGLQSVGFSDLQASILYGNYTTEVLPMLNLVATLVAPISTVMLPVISKAEVKNNTQALSDNLTLYTNIMLLISIPSTFAFLFKAKEILMILFEDSGAMMAAPVLSAISPGIFFMCLLTVINTALEGTGNTKVPMISLSVGAVFKIVFTYILIRDASLGIIGAALGSVISYIISFIISFSYAVLVKKIRLNIFNSFIKTLLAALAAVIISTLVNSTIRRYGVVFSFVELVIFGVLYLLFVILFNYKNILAVKSRQNKQKNCV
jgi:stage V sporulation protein B